MVRLHVVVFDVARIVADGLCLLPFLMLLLMLLLLMLKLILWNHPTVVLERDSMRLSLRNVHNLQ